MRLHEIPAWDGPADVDYLTVYGEQGDLYDFEACELLSVPVQIPAVSFFNSGTTDRNVSIAAWLLYQVDEGAERCTFQGTVFAEPKAATQVNSWRSSAGS